MLSDVFDKLRTKFGKDISLNVIKEKENKVVYEFTAGKDNFILIIIKNASPVKFYKYMHSLWVQQQLYKSGMSVADVVYTYFKNKTIVSVHQKIEGKKDFQRNAENMKKIGALVGKLHRMSESKIYASQKLLLKYPNVFVRFGMFLRNLINRLNSSHLNDQTIRNLPCGVCHRDINETNILLDRNGKMWLLDFDKNRYMPFAEGIVYFYNKHLYNKSMFSSFVEGYLSERSLSDEEKKYIIKKLDLDANIIK